MAFGGENGKSLQCSSLSLELKLQLSDFNVVVFAIIIINKILSNPILSVNILTLTFCKICSFCEYNILDSSWGLGVKLELKVSSFCGQLYYAQSIACLFSLSF